MNKELYGKTWDFPKDLQNHLKICFAKGYVLNIIIKLSEVMIKIAWAGRFLIRSNLFAPTYCDTMDEIALLVCPNTQISIDKKVLTIPTAAKASVALTVMLPTMAASVNDRIGSDIPEIKAGMANLFICFKLIFILTVLIHSNEKDIYFVWGNKYLQVFYSRVAHKTFDFWCFVKRYLIL